MRSSYVMKVSGNGQVSIPAEVRSRWKAERMVVVDLGDRIVMRPLTDDVMGDLVGKYAGGRSTDEERRRARAEDAEADRRHR